MKQFTINNIYRTTRRLDNYEITTEHKVIDRFERDRNTLIKAELVDYTVFNTETNEESITADFNRELLFELGIPAKDTYLVRKSPFLGEGEVAYNLNGSEHLLKA